MTICGTIWGQSECNTMLVNSFKYPRRVSCGRTYLACVLKTRADEPYHVLRPSEDLLSPALRALCQKPCQAGGHGQQWANIIWCTYHVVEKEIIRFRQPSTRYLKVLTRVAHGFMQQTWGDCGVNGGVIQAHERRDIVQHQLLSPYIIIYDNCKSKRLAHSFFGPAHASSFSPLKKAIIWFADVICTTMMRDVIAGQSDTHIF